jgi:PAS domain S-box-containing protein
MLTIGSDLRITGANPALERLIGWQATEIQGRFYYDVLRMEDARGEPLGLARCPLLESFASAAPVVDREIVVRARDGQRLHVAVTASAVRSENGLVTSGILSMRDLHQHHAQEALASTVISVVSHELQTPIAIIKGYASTLSRPEAMRDPHGLQQRLLAIEEEADRLSHMVKNLLYASRIQAGALAIDPAPLEIGEVLHHAVRRFQARGVAHEIRLQMTELPLVWADRGRIEEVVANLLENALKYSPSSRAIMLVGHATATDVIIRVVDGGAGIPLHEQSRVFTRFERLDDSSARQAGGAGLGLYICQALVRAHGGEIWLESDVGHGATFSFNLPRLEPAGMLMVAPTTREQATHVRQRRRPRGTGRIA